MPADPAASLAADLRSAADRARDERLKLAAMVKQQQTHVQLQGGPAPADQVTALGEKIQKLDQAVAQRLQALAGVEQRIDERLARLEELQATITHTSQAFTKQVEQAQHFKHHVDAAKQHVRMSAGQIVEDVRLHLQSFEGPIAERLAALNDLDEQMDKRIARMQQMHKQAGDAVDKHLLGALRQAKEQAVSMVEPIKQELDAFLRDRAAVMEKAVQDKVAALDIDVEDALSPVTSRFEQIVAQAQAQAADLADALPGELDARCESHIDQLRETMIAQVSALMQGWDEKTVEEAAGRYRESVGDKLGSMFDEVDTEAEIFAGRLAEKFDEARQQAEAKFTKVLDQLEMAAAERAAKLADVMASRVGELTDRAQAEVDAVAGEVQLSVTESLDEVVGEIESAVGKKVDDLLASKREQLDGLSSGFARDIDAAFDQAVGRIDALRGQADTARQQVAAAEREAEKLSERLSAITGCINESAEQAREQLADIEGTTGDRLDGVENAVANRVEEIQAELAERMKQIEQDAAAKLGELIEMAESSGVRVAEAITTLTQTAHEQAAQAQRDIDQRIAAIHQSAKEAAGPLTEVLAQKVNAFEQLSQQARDEAQASIRHELAELHSASKAMVEVVNRRLRTQLDQTQTTVELTVQRLEQQLDAVRRSAQRSAFPGQDKSTHDAA